MPGSVYRPRGKATSKYARRLRARQRQAANSSRIEDTHQMLQNALAENRQRTPRTTTVRVAPVPVERQPTAREREAARIDGPAAPEAPLPGLSEKELWGHYKELKLKETQEWFQHRYDIYQSHAKAYVEEMEKAPAYRKRQRLDDAIKHLNKHKWLMKYAAPPSNTKLNNKVYYVANNPWFAKPGRYLKAVALKLYDEDKSRRFDIGAFTSEYEGHIRMIKKMYKHQEYDKIKDYIKEHHVRFYEKGTPIKEWAHDFVNHFGGIRHFWREHEDVMYKYKTRHGQTGKERTKALETVYTPELQRLQTAIRMRRAENAAQARRLDAATAENLGENAAGATRTGHITPVKAHGRVKKTRPKKAPRIRDARGRYIKAPAEESAEETPAEAPAPAPETPKEAPAAQAGHTTVNVNVNAAPAVAPSPATVPDMSPHEAKTYTGVTPPPDWTPPNPSSREGSPVRTKVPLTPTQEETRRQVYEEGLLDDVPPEVKKELKKAFKKFFKQAKEKGADAKEAAKAATAATAAVIKEKFPVYASKTKGLVGKVWDIAKTVFKAAPEIVIGAGLGFVQGGVPGAIAGAVGGVADKVTGAHKVVHETVMPRGKYHQVAKTYLNAALAVGTMLRNSEEGHRNFAREHGFIRNQEKKSRAVYTQGVDQATLSARNAARRFHGQRRHLQMPPMWQTKYEMLQEFERKSALKTYQESQVWSENYRRQMLELYKKDEEDRAKNGDPIQQGWNAAKQGNKESGPTPVATEQVLAYARKHDPRIAEAWEHYGANAPPAMKAVHRQTVQDVHDHAKIKKVELDEKAALKKERKDRGMAKAPGGIESALDPELMEATSPELEAVRRMFSGFSFIDFADSVHADSEEARANSAYWNKLGKAIGKSAVDALNLLGYTGVGRLADWGIKLLEGTALTPEELQTVKNKNEQGVIALNGLLETSEKAIMKARQDYYEGKEDMVDQLMKRMNVDKAHDAIIRNQIFLLPLESGASMLEASSALQDALMMLHKAPDKDLINPEIFANGYFKDAVKLINKGVNKVKNVTVRQMKELVGMPVENKDVFLKQMEALMQEKGNELKAKELLLKNTITQRFMPTGYEQDIELLPETHPVKVLFEAFRNPKGHQAEALERNFEGGFTLQKFSERMQNVDDYAIATGQDDETHLKLRDAYVTGPEAEYQKYIIKPMHEMKLFNAIQEGTPHVVNLIQNLNNFGAEYGQAKYIADEARAQEEKLKHTNDLHTSYKNLATYIIDTADGRYGKGSKIEDGVKFFKSRDNIQKDLNRMKPVMKTVHLLHKIGFPERTEFENWWKNEMLPDLKRRGYENPFNFNSNLDAATRLNLVHHIGNSYRRFYRESDRIKNVYPTFREDIENYFDDNDRVEPRHMNRLQKKINDGRDASYWKNDTEDRAKFLAYPERSENMFAIMSAMPTEYFSHMDAEELDSIYEATQNLTPPQAVDFYYGKIQPQLHHRTGKIRGLISVAKSIVGKNTDLDVSGAENYMKDRGSITYLKGRGTVVSLADAVKMPSAVETAAAGSGIPAAQAYTETQIGKTATEPALGPEDARRP